ncbi:unnamed protein product [Adineta steineri]|uniref:Uncharacterized protein n=1 Tax=Adineta steineri TaxID=433720 RepID=A0A815CU70_9BILA|nr:unnamed protein product [Adineta steineri]CAF1090600.1 unnamed protein product [Adineta steineri]CAF1284670.1 unnamed protein product [Adineta steineri]CAF1284754.1 unnamed protein product [Adineta steineri]
MPSKTNGEEFKEQLEDIIKCPICLDNFNEPRILPCSHTYCLQCIKDLAASNQGQFICPLRDGITISSTNIDSLPLNLAIRDIVDLVTKHADNRSAAPHPPSSVLPSVMTASTDSLRQQQTIKFVKVIDSYVAEHDDELTIQPGDLILLLERRPDQWCKGNLHGKIGLFPGNFVQDI